MLPRQVFEKDTPGFDIMIVLVLHVAEETSKVIAAFAGACKALLSTMRSAAVLAWLVSTAVRAAASGFEPREGIVMTGCTADGGSVRQKLCAAKALLGQLVVSGHVGGKRWGPTESVLCSLLLCAQLSDATSDSAVCSQQPSVCREEGGCNGDIVVQDSLKLLNGLLWGNAGNCKLFR